MKAKINGLLIVAVLYILAAAAGTAAFIALHEVMHSLIAMFLADTAATVVVWLGGVLFKNSSVYDPYWSVAPPVMILGWFIERGTALNAAEVVMISAVTVWAVRLTANWVYGFPGLQWQDWRYRMYRERFPKIWQLVNFFGINYFPTVLVFLGTAPAYVLIAAQSGSALWAAAGAAVCVFAAGLSFVSDMQLHRYRRTEASRCRTIDSGLWRYSRHPNYLGEVLFWYGVLIMCLGAAELQFFMFFGAPLITLLFVFISIPMIEKRLSASRADYADYKKRVSRLLLLPRRKTGEGAADIKN